MTWRDYLMENSVEQFINGNETELRESMKTLTEMELYFERYVSPLSFNIITDAVNDLDSNDLTIYP